MNKIQYYAIRDVLSLESIRCEHELEDARKRGFIGTTLRIFKDRYTKANKAIEILDEVMNNG